MSEQSEQAPIVITLKGGAGFEAPWLVLRAQSAEDAVALLGETEFVELPKLIAGYADSFRASQTGAAPAQAADGARTSSPSSSVRTSTTGRQGAPRGAAPQNQNQSSDIELHPEGLTCHCGGAVQFKKITAKASGKTFEMWVCPNQRSKGDGHFSEFIN